MYPDAQKKAQAQIDTVVGTDRLLTFDDLQRLPYVRAVVKEVGRWHSATPLGMWLHFRQVLVLTEAVGSNPSRHR